MSLIWLDGFDGYQFSQWSNRGWDGRGGSTVTAFDTTNKKTGSASYALSTQHEYLYKNFPLSPAIRTAVMGFHIWVGTDRGGLPDGIMAFGSSDRQHVSLACAFSGSPTKVDLYCYRGSQGGNGGRVQLGSVYTGAFPVYEWHYVEMKVYVDSTAGTFEVFVDGTRVINLTGQNTQNTTENFIRSGFVSDNNHWYPAYDDMPITNKKFDNAYMIACDATAPNDRWGPLEIQPLYPVDEGAYTDFTAVGAGHAHDCVKEIPYDGDTTYIKSNTIGNKHLFTLDSYSPANPWQVLAISPMPFVKKTHENVKKIKTIIRANGVDAESSEYTLAKFEKNIYRGVYDYAFLTNPNTGTNWVLADLSTLQAGVQISGGLY